MAVAVVVAVAVATARRAARRLAPAAHGDLHVDRIPQDGHAIHAALGVLWAGWHTVGGMQGRLHAAPAACITSCSIDLVIAPTSASRGSSNSTNAKPRGRPV